MRREQGKINFVSLFFMLVLGTGVYLSWIYIPIVWTKNELGNVVREATFNANRSTDEQVRKSLIEAAKLDHDVDLKVEDIEITRYSDRVRIHVVWRPVVHFVFGNSIQHAFEITESATFY